MIRLHTYCRGRFTLWADRVPAVHGRVNLFTLWERRPDSRNIRLAGGIGIADLRQLIKGMK